MARSRGRLCVVVRCREESKAGVMKPAKTAGEQTVIPFQEVSSELVHYDIHDQTRLVLKVTAATASSQAQSQREECEETSIEGRLSSQHGRQNTFVFQGDLLDPHHQETRNPGGGSPEAALKLDDMGLAGHPFQVKV